MHDDGCISPTRVLLVEDHERFRRFIRTTLTKQKSLEVIAEACDGLDAIRKCLEQQPDLVLMDLGLPRLNGIEAARRIRGMFPACKIVFLSQERSPEIMREAFVAGASGYVVKAKASDDLMPAIAAALNGGQFASRISASRKRVGETVQIAPAGAAHQTSAAQSDGGSHPVHFHPDEPALLAEFAEFIDKTLAAGRAVIAIITPPHRAAMLRIFEARGLEVAAAMESGQLVLLDVDETLAAFMVDDLPDADRFFSGAGEIVKSVKARNRGRRVLACGECAPILWSRGNGAAAVRLEYLWDQLVRIHDLDTLCGYTLSNQRSQDRRTYDAICAAHSSVVSFCH